MSEKIRTIITQDAEVDDQNSLRHFLFYANEVELQGIIQTASTFHWIGVPGKVRPPEDESDRRPFRGPRAPFDKPHRWPGTEWMFHVLDDYERDYPNLSRHAAGYPTPDSLRAITKIGNLGYEGEMDAPTEGSELIRARILDEDPRMLYLQAWGGPNTIARALMDIETEYRGTEQWEALHRKISDKVVITACGEQDGTYRSYIAEVWPDIAYVHAMGTYGYSWLGMPEGESKDNLRAAFMVPGILNGKSALMDGYCTWMDGHHYEGEVGPAQFGTNPNILNEWFGARMGMPRAEKYDFLSEGDSPTFFMLFNWGLRTTDDLRNGGFSGRYVRAEDQFNSRGERLNLWRIANDHYTDKDGNRAETNSMWPYVADIQRDWAARVAWCGTDCFEETDHVPTIAIREGTDLDVCAGERLVLHAEACAPDADVAVAVTWNCYEEASASCAAGLTLTAEDRACTVVVPITAEPGDRIHIIGKAQSNGPHRLVHYQQVILHVK